MSSPSVGSRIAQFLRSLAVLAALAVGAPMALLRAARSRFGGGSPVAGVPSPADWEWGRIRSALTDRLTEDTIADIVIRTALVVAWVALAVFLVTVVAEAVHMVRHAGLHLPDVRGLGITQQAARVVAAGLLVLLPMFATPNRAVARGDTTLTPLARPAATHVVGRVDAAAIAPPADAITAATPVADPVAAPVPGGHYVVRSGDSIYAIAAQVAGDDPVAVAEYAEQIVERNLGRDMGDGSRFTNAAFIDVGWVLELPAGPSPPAAPAAPATADVQRAAHTVEHGETLWSIAEDELGDPLRWPELYAANAGRTFDDGRMLSDPDVIQPGWDLDLPGTPAVGTPPPPAAPSATPAPTVEVAAPAVDPVATSEAGPSADRAQGTRGAHDAHHPGGSLGAQARADNVWADPAGAPAVPAAADRATAPASGAGSESAAWSLIDLRGAAMLSAGVLTLLAARRRQQLRRAVPRAVVPHPSAEEAATERTLRAVDAAERLARVDIAVRASALPLVHRGRRVLAVRCAPDGGLELIADGPAPLPSPFVATASEDRWTLSAATPIELLAASARQVGAPCPTLVQLGVDDAEYEVFVDLEALEAIEVDGPDGTADAIVAAIALTLAGSVLAEVTTLVSVDVPADAFLGHRLHRTAVDAASAFQIASKAVGATASMTASTFELRARVTSGEAWEPAVVLFGSSGGAFRPPRNRTGLAVVSAAPIEGPSSRLAVEGSSWVLRPLGLRLRPIGVPPGEVAAIADLVEGAAAVPELRLDDAAIDDVTIYDEPVPAVPDDAEAVAPAPVRVGETTAERLRPTVRRTDDVPPPPPWQLLVRLIGPVSVTDIAGGEVAFERSKTRELIAWLATHRGRATRTSARTALWEQDVRDATFANVVSEARRSLARLVEPPDGEEWVGRTMTDALPLHPLVRTDAELVEHALAVARVQPPDLAIRTLGPAVELIAGMPFEGTSFLWPDAEGLMSSLILLATSAAAELAAHCLSVGDVEGVFRATGRGLRVLAGHEELIALRMRAHARVGDLAGVRSEWESYERMINADPWSDGEPSPKLVDLRTRLMNPSR
jgi:LysM domain